MNKAVIDFVEFITSDDAPKNNKENVIESAKKRFNLMQDRKVYFCNYFAVRFSFSKNGTFSNTILSLSHLLKYDKIPFFVVLVRGNNTNIIYIANTTFLSKISHSSKLLSTDNIKGSFNGSDIMKKYGDIENKPHNFKKLFAIHDGLDWSDNLLRLVDKSSKIKSQSQKFMPTSIQLDNITSSIDRAISFTASTNFSILEKDLNDRCESCKEAIWVASRIDNINIRGRIIEAMITSTSSNRNTIIEALKNLEEALPVYDTHNELGDYVRSFENGDTYTDIKTKIIYLDSAPKAYNIDKFLKKMAEKNSSFFFFFIGINEAGVCNTRLCSVYHNELLSVSKIQHHWSGRSTRGVIQFNGDMINKILNAQNFKNNIDKNAAIKYISDLLQL